MVVIEAITLDDDQSCQALNAALMTHTTMRTSAKARLASAGGSPRGFHAMNTRIPPPRRIVPKPPKRYPIIV
jgi:hypothetical protein